MALTWQHLWALGVRAASQCSSLFWGGLGRRFAIGTRSLNLQACKQYLLRGSKVNKQYLLWAFWSPIEWGNDLDFLIKRPRFLVRLLTGFTSVLYGLAGFWSWDWKGSLLLSLIFWKSHMRIPRPSPSFRFHLRSLSRWVDGARVINPSVHFDGKSGGWGSFVGFRV